jgi:hypothetical protein
MYETQFKLFFQKIGERAGVPVQWYHLYTDGFYGTTVDMDSKQMAGKKVLKHIQTTL